MAQPPPPPPLSAADVPSLSAALAAALDPRTRPDAEAALAGMRAGGVRTARVPAARGFGPDGATLRPTEHVPEKRGEVPPGADLEYRLQVVSVSVPPS